MLAEQKRLAKERAKEQRQMVSSSLACEQPLLGFPRVWGWGGGGGEGKESLYLHLINLNICVPEWDVKC